jgi:hypothetical protein
MTKDTSVIPHGYYCYDDRGICPYWSSDPSKGAQNYGYCSYLEKGDWEDEEDGGWSLLWDQVKECFENMDNKEDE